MFSKLSNSEILNILLEGRDLDELIARTEVTKKITEYMGSLIEYMLKQDLKILPLPNIKLRRDKENAALWINRFNRF